MRWFRWYRGTAEQARFRVIAARASTNGTCGGSTHENRVDGAVFHTDVLAVWVALLEDAGNALHWGYVTRDARYIATQLDLGEPEVEAILREMVIEEMIEASVRGNGTSKYHIVNWEKYQFVSDTDPTSSERQKRYRERRVSHALQTRTDTDTDTDKKRGANAPYAFQGKIIKLSQTDFDLWKQSFGFVDTQPYLVARDQFLVELPEDDNRRKKWMVSTASDLRNKNTEAKAKKKPPTVGLQFKPEVEIVKPPIEQREKQVSRIIKKVAWDKRLPRTQKATDEEIKSWQVEQ